MNTFYAASNQTEEIKGESKTCNCDCGQSTAIQIDEVTEVIICDSCYENSPNFKKYI